MFRNRASDEALPGKLAAIPDDNHAEQQSTGHRNFSSIDVTNFNIPLQSVDFEFINIQSLPAFVLVQWAMPLSAPPELTCPCPNDYY